MKETADKLAQLPLTRRTVFMTPRNIDLSANIWTPDVTDRDSFTDLPAVKELLAYLSEHSRSAADGEKPRDPDDLAFSNFYELIWLPILAAGQDEAVRSSVGQPRGDWHISPEKLTKLADALVSYKAGRGRRVKIIVPITGLRLENVNRFAVEPDVLIRSWTDENRAVFEVKHGYSYAFEEHLTSSSYVELSSNDSHFSNGGLYLSHEKIEDYISEKMGKIKWALVHIGGPGCCIGELPAAVEISFSRWLMMPLRRQRTLRGHHPILSCEQEDMEKVKILIDALNHATERFRKDLRDVLWLFDRSMTAGTPKDVILESAIGLERLLVADTGDIGHRFRTFGAALISRYDAAKTSEKLKNIYNRRSRAAHGGSVDGDKDEEEMSKVARCCLADAIAAVVQLIGAGKVETTSGKSKEPLAKSVERYLVSLMHKSARDEVKPLW